MTPLERLQWAYTAPVEKSTERAVLVAIAFMAGDMSAFPTIETLMAMTKYGRSAVIAARDALVAMGLITSSGPRGYHAKTYRLVIEQPSTTQTVHGVNGSPGESKPSTRRTQTVHHVDLNKEVTRKEPGSRRNRYPDDFEQMWKIYPKRAGDNSKKKAAAAWSARLREGHTADAMMKGVQDYAAWCEATGKIGTEHVMMAATFFGPDDPPRFLVKRERPNERQERVLYATATH